MQDGGVFLAADTVLDTASSPGRTKPASPDGPGARIEETRTRPTPDGTTCSMPWNATPVPPDTVPALRPVRPRVDGKFLAVADRRLPVRGVTYGTFRPGPDGSGFPSTSRVERDFSMMTAAGINAVRTYEPPPRRVLDAAWHHGLRLLVGLPWEQHVAFLDDRGRARSIERRIRSAVASCAGHPAILAYAVGNEIPAPVVRWSGRRRIEDFLRRLTDCVRHEDPEGLVTYANYPSTEYLELPFLDFHCVNVYLESAERLAAYLSRLQNLAGDRPLVLGEVGLDSRRNGEVAQARAIESQIRTAVSGGCAGLFVFSWTDEWYRGGREVEDWDFGLTARDRSPKPALTALRRTLAGPPLTHTSLPRISVVVCVYNAESTVRDCLEGLARLDYANAEVIVVDDGSTDRTAEIAREFDVRLISTENRGLSAARNTGLEAATGQIVAYIDGDAWPDPEWLTYLADTFSRGGYAGVGGPNLPPPGDGLVAECVASAPGGPVHVLVTDREAEHIPGVNMAFWKSALEEVGGFDPVFRVAGDDVDICWRLQERGLKLGFAPAAVVWHHHRPSVRAYLKQQWGYGKAEALLEAKWPEKYNPAGHVTWGGRVYGRGLSLLGWTSRIYHGTWGKAPFQSMDRADSGVFWSFTTTPEWYLVIAVLAVLAGLGAFWPPLLAAAPILAAATGALVFRAVRATTSTEFPSVPVGIRRAWMKGLTASLHVLQPLARLMGRLSFGLTPWRLPRSRGFRAPYSRTESVWSEVWESVDGWLEGVERRVRASGGVVRRGGPYDRWDLEIRGGLAGRIRLRTCVEEHGDGRQLARFRLWPEAAWTPMLLAAGSGILAARASADGAGWVAVVLGLLALLMGVRVVRECGWAMASALAAIASGSEVETTAGEGASRASVAVEPPVEIPAVSPPLPEPETVAAAMSIRGRMAEVGSAT